MILRFDVLIPHLIVARTTKRADLVLEALRTEVAKKFGVAPYEVTDISEYGGVDLNVRYICLVDIKGDVGN